MGAVVILVLAVAAVITLGLVTAIGQGRRGARPLVIVLSGVFFPVAWIGWYLHDELPRSTSSSRRALVPRRRGGWVRS